MKMSRVRKASRDDPRVGRVCVKRSSSDKKKYMYISRARNTCFL